MRRTTLLNFIADNFLVDQDEIDLEKSLVDEGIVDSTGMVEIISFIEEEYSFEVEEDKMTRENFGSVLKIVDFIKNEMALQSSPISKAI